MKLTLNAKFLLLQLPLFIVTTSVAWIAWSTHESLKSQGDNQALNDYAQKSALYVAEMGSALKGYMLDPNNEREAQRKKEADENNVKAIEAMSKLTTDAALLTKIKTIGEFDEKELNPAEDRVLTLVANKNFTEARLYFTANYLPLRAKYDQMSSEITSISEKQTHDATIRFEESARGGLQKIIVFVILGFLFSASFLLYTLSKVTKSLLKLKAQLQQETKEIHSTSMSLSETTEGLTTASTQSAAAIQESVSAISEMRAMLAQTAKTTSTTTELAQDVHQKSHEGVTIMEKMSSSMNEISSANARLKEIIKIIGAISGKTNVINDIVFKTQMLSVNASIEAARAGQHGRGFSVVANEVASLAALSGKAAEEIRELLQASSDQVNEIIEGTSTSVDQGAKVSTVAVESFSSIAGLITKMLALIQQINEASQEQETGISQTQTSLNYMNESTTNTNTLTHRNANLSSNLKNQANRLVEVEKTMTLLVTGEAEDHQANPTAPYHQQNLRSETSSQDSKLSHSDKKEALAHFLNQEKNRAK